MRTASRTRGSLGWIPVITLAATIALLGSSGRAPRLAGPTAPVGLVECPHDWAPYLTQDSLVVPGELALPGRTTHIPEFHDCQKFITTDHGQLRYLPLFAIFGAWDMQGRWDSISAHHATSINIEPNIRLTAISGDSAAIAPIGSVTTPAIQTPGSQSGRNSGTARGFVEVYAEGDYAPLGIGAGFNCAYLYYSDATLWARMVRYHGTERDCRLPADPDTLAGTLLQVVRTRHPMHAGTGAGVDYPAAARWDWDPTNRIQYFGVKCGDGWCEVGPYGFARSALPPVPTAMDMPPANGHRVRHIKGWFDQQRLAPPIGASPTRPASGWGTVFAHPALGTYRVRDFDSTWLFSARVAMDSSLAGYETKLNLTPANAANPAINRVFMCRGAWDACLRAVTRAPRSEAALRGVPRRGSTMPTQPTCATEATGVLPADVGVWWAAIVSAKNQVAFRCVIRRDHRAALDSLGITAPATARWRWRVKDETIWMACDQGCCEVEVLCTGPGCS